MEWTMIRRLTISLTIDKELLRELENLRGKEKRSPLIERLVRPGLEEQKGVNVDPKKENLISPAESAWYH
jgi:metal-responsive CopG/Arc/MetJ family transcriptional regulator